MSSNNTTNLDINLIKYKNKVNNWLLLSSNSYYEQNEYYVKELFDILINWMTHNNLISRFNDNNELYDNFLNMLYQTTSHKNSHKFFNHCYI